MPTYKITDPASGKTIRLTGDSPPNEAELNQIFESAKRNEVPRSTGQKVAAAVAPHARPVLEYGGMMVGGTAGGALGATAGGIGAAPGAIVGAGLGYAGGRNIAKWIDEQAGNRKNESVFQNFLTTGKDVVSGAAMETGGQVVGAAIKLALNWLAKKAPAFYESAMKIPPSVPNDIRNKAVETGIEGKYAPTQKGLAKLRGNIDNLNKQIGDAIDGMVQTKSITKNIPGKTTISNILGPNGQPIQNIVPPKQVTGPGGTIDMNEVVKRVDELKAFYKRLPPKVAQDYIEPLENLQKKFASGGNITPREAQGMKKTLYALNRNHYGELSSTIVEGNKAIARGLKEELVKQYPELANLNAKDSALINLEEVLERAVNRSRNYDVIRLGDTVMAAAGGIVGGTGGMEGAFFAKRIIESPAVKASLAFALKRVGKIPPLPTISRAALWGAMRRKDNEE